jgi:cyanophycinase
MRKAWLVFLVLLGMIPRPGFPEVKGYLFIIGGGERPGSMMRRFVDLAGRFGNGKIVVFPMASSVPVETGSEEAEEFRKLGAADVEYVILSRGEASAESSLKVLAGAGGVFFSGGDQSRLMDVLRGTPFQQKLLELYRDGCVIGGTSAGAAVMSQVTITGEEKGRVEEGREFGTILAGNVVTVSGLGFLKTVIVDQHFATRKRHNRLISLVAENPELLGVGIDESTAIIVRPDQVFEVIGEKNVVIYDASRARIRITPAAMIGFTGMIMDVLIPGDKFDLKTRQRLP